MTQSINLLHPNLIQKSCPYFLMTGCGGYIYGDGEVTSPDNLSSLSDVTDCIWFLEARDSEGIILLKRNVDLIDEKDKSTSKFPENHPIMTV
jgi:hypothetical protein